MPGGERLQIHAGVHGRVHVFILAALGCQYCGMVATAAGKKDSKTWKVTSC